MGAARVQFESFDEATREQAQGIVAALDAGGGDRVSLQVEGDLARILRSFVTVALDAGGVAYGPLSSELSPEQAGRILGVSRPLVVQRMEDGRLPFHYVGKHRRCLLSDVLNLKAREREKGRVPREPYQEIEDLESDPRP